MTRVLALPLIEQTCLKQGIEPQLSTPEQRTAGQALHTYAAAVRLVLRTMDFNFVDGKLVPNPRLMKYLDDRGAIANKDAGE